MANGITLSRLPLLALILGMLFWGNGASRLVAVILILILILMDSLDGFIARRLNESSLLGSALDIAADRAVELVLWVSFEALGLIPLVIPLVVIVRGTLTDSVRAVASSHGVRAYDMLRSRWASFLVASPAMRTTYAVSKGFAFCLLALTLALSTLWPAVSITPTQEMILNIVTIAGQAFSWLSLALCQC
jgi:CDP-diacylglycerol---glycerol-3-phosphate 3-phosphatidyltransferase